MEYILQNTDIFDGEIDIKFNNVIIANKDDFIKENVYKFTASFHVNLLNDTRFEEFHIPDSKRPKEEKIYDVMTFQLKKLERILAENGVEIYSTTIMGDCLEAEDIIKIQITEDTSEPNFYGRGKNKKRWKTRSIMPSRPYTEKVALEAAKILIKKTSVNIANSIIAEAKKNLGFR